MPRTLRGKSWTYAGAVAGIIQLSLGASASAVAADGVIYTSAWQAGSFNGLASDLRGQLSQQFSYDLGRADSDIDVLRLVRADPRSVGFVQRDLFVARLQQRPEEYDRLEFYGDIAACLVVITRKGAQFQSYEQLVAAQPDRNLTLDVGPAAGRVANTFEILSGLDPDLGNLRLEHRGGARALSRVVSGDTDAALLISYAPFHAPDLDKMIDEDAVDLMPLVTKRLAAAALQQNAPYALREIELGTGGWLQSRRRYRTTCSTLGVVVNERADIRLSEAVAQAMLHGSSDLGRDRPMRGLQELVAGIVTHVVRLAADLSQMAVALVLGGQETAKATDGSAQTLEFRLQDPAPKSTVTLRPNGS
ncbi:MAG: hypothetical protein HYR63_01805 [Proteobacteria bacterium]|nr:hypothetical protein [Pseudomonadota bacterium]